ncbi:PREDICTED: uncharacterized protein LOC109181871 isoform X2 [Ipomoea nil]|uniref:uncharacterized protein LOC109181871 isoform X2 n=1 Tax=Ipomoea nil TaxID=35883 RepID=UPI000900BDBC|nr:PREDICTED: uncharacterized protein LOC109181871 isoform X2 [Ipomoea nil]
MIRIGDKLCRARRLGSAFALLRPPAVAAPPPRRVFSDKTDLDRSFKVNPVALEMTNYALSLARSKKSDDAYAQAQLVLEQCYSTNSDENARGMVLLAMSTLLYNSGNYEEAIEKLQKIQQLSSSSTIVRVAASEALVGLHLELGQDDASSVIVNVCLRLLETIRLELGSAGFEALEDHSRALKGLVELVRGDTKSAASFFPEVRDGDCSSNVLDQFIGNAALSYGEFLHRMGDFEMAKQLYTRVIHEESLGKSSSYLHQLSACNMNFEDVILGATCALGQLEAHLGNFDKAEKMLTEALVKAEETFVHMYRNKSTVEESSSLLIQEGLYRRAIELLKAPPLETEGAEEKACRRDIIALARGGYAETLCLQQNRKAEGERIKLWAESAWKNPRLSLAEALEPPSESSSKVAVIDTRICRVI